MCTDVKKHMCVWHHQGWQVSRRKELRAGLCFRATLVFSKCEAGIETH